MTDTTTSTQLKQQANNIISAEDCLTNLNLAIKQNKMDDLNKYLAIVHGSLCRLHINAQAKIAKSEQEDNKYVHTNNHKKTVITHPLMLAIEMGRDEMVASLLKSKQGILPETLSHAVKFTVENRKIEIIKIIVEIKGGQLPKDLIKEILSNKMVLPEIKFLLDSKATLEAISYGYSTISDLFQISKYLDAKDVYCKAASTKELFACLEVRLENTIISGGGAPIALILSNQELPVTLSMVVKAYQLAKKSVKDKSTSEDRRKTILGMVELFERKMQELEEKKNEKEKSIFDLAKEHDYDEVFSWVLKKQPLEQVEANQLFTQLNNKVAMQQKILESDMLPKERILQLLNETECKKSKNDEQIFNFIITATHYKETLKQFVGNKLASGAFDIIHSLLLTHTISLSLAEIIEKMDVPQKKKMFQMTRNIDLIKSLVSSLGLYEKFDLLVEAFNLKNHENFLNVYNNLSLKEKVEIWLHLVKQRDQNLLDHLLLQRSTEEIIQVITFLEEPQPELTNILLKKLTAKQTMRLLEDNPHFKNAVITFIGSQLSLKQYDKVKNFLELHSDIISLGEIVEQMTVIQKQSMLFKGVNEKIIGVLLKSLTFDDKLSLFARDYSTNEHKTLILEVFLRLPINEKSNILSILIKEQKNNLFQLLIQKNIEEIINAIALAEQPVPELMEAFLNSLTSKQTRQLVEGNPFFKDAVKTFLEKKLDAGDTFFVAAVFSSPLKNLARKELKTAMTVQEKMDSLSQVTDRNHIDVSLFNELPVNKKFELIGGFFNRQKQDIALATYGFITEPKEKGHILLSFAHHKTLPDQKKYEWINVLMPQDLRLSISFILLNLKMPPAVLTNKLLEMVSAPSENLKYFLDFFKNENKKNILEVYKTLSAENKMVLLSACIQHSKKIWAEYLISQTLEDSFNLILKAKKIDEKLPKILFEQLSLVPLDKLTESFKKNIIGYMIGHIRAKNYSILNDDILVHENLSVLFSECIIKIQSSDNKYNMLVNFADQGCDTLVKLVLNYVTLEQKLKLLSTHLQIDRGRIVSNVYRNIPLREMAEILLIVTKKKNVDQILFIINSFYIKAEAYANARTGKLKQLLQSSPALNEAMILFIKEQFGSQAFVAIAAMLRSPLREIIQDKFISPMSEEGQFNLLIAAANKGSDPVVRLLLEQVHTSEQRFNFYSKYYQPKHQFALTMIFKAQDRTGDLKKKFDMFTMAIQHKNDPLVAFFKSIEDERFKKFVEAAIQKDKKFVFGVLAEMNEYDFLKTWLLENIEESIAIILPLVKEQPQIESHQKLINFLLEVLPAERLKQLLDEHRDLINVGGYIGNQLDRFSLRKGEAVLSQGICHVLQIMAVKNVEYVQDIIDKMNEPSKMSLLLAVAKNAPVMEPRKNIIRIILNSLTVEQKRSFVSKYIEVQGYRSELSNLYLSLTSEEMLDIFDNVLITQHDKGKKRQSDWIHAIEFKNIEQDKQKTIMLAEKRHPLLTMALLKLLSAEERIKLFKAVNFADYLQECMNYDDETYKMFLSAAKRKIDNITNSFVKDSILKENLLKTAKLQNHQDVIKYINNGNKGIITSEFKKNEECLVINPPKMLNEQNIQTQQATSNTAQQKLLVDYMAIHAPKVVVPPQNQQTTKPKPVIEPNISPEQQKLLNDFAQKSAALTQQNSAHYVPPSSRASQKQEDPRYTPAYIQQHQAAQASFIQLVSMTQNVSAQRQQTTQLSSIAPRGGERVIVQNNPPPPIQRVQSSTTNNVQTPGFLDMLRSNPLLGSIYSSIVSAPQQPTDIERVYPAQTVAPTQPQQPRQPNHPPQAVQQQTPPPAANNNRRPNLPQPRK